MHEPLPDRSTIAGTERHIFHRDIESLSRVDLRTVGADKYAADPSTDVYCYAYAVDDGPVKLWIRGDPVPAEAVEAAKNPTWSAAAHGDHFETVMERHILAPRYGFPLVPVERHVCTMPSGRLAG
jgi:DNA polymerase bacteriophage-type